MPPTLRVVVARSGDADHDVAVERAARALRTAGAEVIDLGRCPSADALAEACLQEDADAVVAPGAPGDGALAAALSARGRDDLVRVDTGDDPATVVAAISAAVAEQAADGGSGLRGADN